MDRVNWNQYNAYNYYSQINQDEGQHASRPETGQSSSGLPASEPLGSHLATNWEPPAPGLSSPVVSSPSMDWESLLRTPSPVRQGDINQSDALTETSGIRPKRKIRDRSKSIPVKDRFLAGLEEFGRGVPVKNCSTTISMNKYITDNGRMINYGVNLYASLNLEEKERVDKAVIDRNTAKGTVEERFCQGLKISHGAFQ